MNDQIESLYHKIGQSIINSLPDQWMLAWVDAEISPEVNFINGGYLVSQDAKPASFKVNEDAIFAFEDLQNLMANPPKPIWKKAHFELSPDGKFDLKFEY